MAIGKICRNATIREILTALYCQNNGGFCLAAQHTLHKYIVLHVILFIGILNAYT